MSTLMRLLFGSAVAVGALSSGRAIGQDGNTSGAEHESLVATNSEPFRFDPANAGVDLLPSVSLGSLQDSTPAEDLPDFTPIAWRLRVDSTWWLPLKIKGDVDVGTTVTKIDVDLDTLFDDLDFILEGGVTLTNDQWTFILWGLYLNVETDVKTETVFGEFDTSLQLKAVLLDFATTYRIGDWPLGDSKTARWRLDALVGFRYWNIDLEINETDPFGFDPHISEQSDWFDPIVGAMLLFDISDKWRATFRADIGGFNIGSASDHTWRLEALGYYRLSPRVELVAGFRYLDFDWSEGSGTNKVGYDWKIYGPIVGVTITF